MKKNILLSLCSFLLLTSCNDKMFSKGKEVVTTPGLGTDPTTSPLRFSGIKSISEITDTSAKITWEHTHGAATYTIVLDDRVHSVVFAPQAETILTGLQPQTSYKLRVRLMDEMTLVDDQFDTYRFTTLESNFLANDVSTQFRGSQSIELKESNKIFSHPQNFSISLWFKTGHEHTGVDARLFTLHKSLEAGTALSLGIENNKLFLLASNSLNQNVKHSFTAVSDNQWHHAAISYHEDSLALYLDGELIHQQRLILTSFGPHKAEVASYTGWQKAYTGLMDDLSFWNEALNDTQVTELFNLRATSNLKNFSDLALWLRMGDHPEDGPEALVDELSGAIYPAAGLTSADFINEAP